MTGGVATRRPRTALSALTVVVVWLVLALRLGLDPALPALLAAAVVGVELARADLAEFRLPDALLRAGAMVALPLLGGAALVAGPGRLLAGLLGAAGMFAVFLAVAMLRPADLGYGDVKAAGYVGLHTGWFGLQAWTLGLLAGFLLAAPVAVGALLAGRGRRTPLPFSPFLLAGGLLAVLTGASR